MAQSVSLNLKAPGKAFDLFVDELSQHGSIECAAETAGLTYEQGREAYEAICAELGAQAV